MDKYPRHAHIEDAQMRQESLQPLAVGLEELADVLDQRAAEPESEGDKHDLIDLEGRKSHGEHIDEARLAELKRRVMEAIDDHPQQL